MRNFSEPKEFSYYTVYNLNKELDSFGIYVIFKGPVNFYIGKGQIKTRLERHLKGETNKNLKDFVRAYGKELFVSYFLCEENEMHDIEAFLINKFNPKCNIKKEKQRCFKEYWQELSWIPKV